MLRPVNMRDPKGLERLNLLLRPFLLRREKNMEIGASGGGTAKKKGVGGTDDGDASCSRKLLDLPKKKR